MYMDNLSCHHSRLAQQKMEQLQIRPIFNAAYFPDGNPIEFVFSIVKREYITRKLDNILNGRKHELRKEIRKAFEKPTLS